MAERVSHSLITALRSVPDFGSLDEDALLRIVGASANLVWPAGSLVFQTGGPSEALYVILSGRVRIYEVVEGREQHVSTIGPGDSFGELSLMLHTTHTKDALAEEDVELMVVPKDSFEELLEANPGLAAEFRRRVEERQPVLGGQPQAT